MKIVHIILFSFFIILALFTITTYINYRQAELIDENSEAFSRSSVVIRHSNRFQRNFLNMVSGLRGYLLTNETFFIQTYDSAIQENEKILQELDTLGKKDPSRKETLSEIRQLHLYWINEFADPLLNAKRVAQIENDSSRRAFDRLYKQKIVDGLEKDVQLRLQRKFSQFTNEEYKFRESQKEKLTAAVRSTKSISFTLTAISVVAGMCIAVFIAHFISSKLVRMVKMANAISEGNYAIHLEESNTELGQLAIALNRMSQMLSLNFSTLKRQRDELDQFAHIVSHDLKAPLRGIDNVVTWIEEDHSFALPPKVNEYLELIKGRIVRAENLLKGILTYARISRQESQNEMVDLNLLLTDIQEYIPRRDGIDLFIAPGFPVLNTEKVPLIQIFTNLISNAYKYHDKKNGFIKVYYREYPEQFEFVVEDNGPGIDKIYHEKIFVIFQTLTERDSFESTGVGLSIVKKILDDRGLRIKLISEKGHGSVFSFTWNKTEIK